MKTKTPLYLLLFLSSATLPACEYSPFGKKKAPQNSVFVKTGQDHAFADYWYTGRAEINTYQIEISRYGETRKGKEVLIFVTEDFDPERQVKLESAEEESPKVNVLKRNSIRRFVTGIYDYSMMSSIFTPVSFEQRSPSLKLNMSAQDWCGHSFLQVNRHKDQYRFKQFSYFGNIGDVEKKLPGDILLEDEVFNLLRLGPDVLPEGEYDLLPGAFYLRLSHEKPAPRAARIHYQSGEANPRCVIEYLHLNRTLFIEFEAEFPHRILGWTEKDDRQLLLKAELMTTMQSPYWEQNKNGFEHLRDSLGLTPFF